MALKDDQLPQFFSISPSSIRAKKEVDEPIVKGKYVAFHIGGDTWITLEVAMNYEQRSLQWRMIDLQQQGSSAVWSEITASESESWGWSTQSVKRYLLQYVPSTVHGYLSKAFEQYKSTAYPVYAGSLLAFNVGGDRWRVWKVSFDRDRMVLDAYPLREVALR
ncbi:MAG: hypothetical protein Kow00121_68040 [Elainellaceae cyanobacterium]